IIKGMSQAAKVKQKMIQLGINTIQQILNGNSNEGLEWNKIAQNINKIPRGKEPKWYKVIQNRCKEWTINNVKPNSEQNRAMVHKLENTDKGWCITTKGIIGKITRIGSRVQIDCNKRVRAKLNILKDKIRQRQPKSQLSTAISTLHFNPKIRRQQELIKNAIKEEEIQLELMEIRDKVSQTNQTVHTVEMEVIEKSLDETRNEIIAVWKIDNTNITFSQTLRTWPSKTNQILTTITCILLIIPSNHNVNIKVNQKIVQLIEEQRVKENMKGVVSLLGKIKHWTSWATLYTVSGRKNIGWSVAYSEHIKSLYDIYKTQQTPPTGSHKNDYKSGTTNNFSEWNAVELTGILKENKDKRNNEIKPLAGIITKEVEQEINAFSKGFKGKKSFCCLILHKINNNLHKQMWKRRCIYTTAITNDLILEKMGDEVQEEVKPDRRKEVMERANRK
ncbi:9280_t:CDS:2, partial [Gigaspora rosea]